MIITAAILAVLAGAVLPLTRVTYVRYKESELRRVLRELRRAIDNYHAAEQQGQICGTDVKLGNEHYPSELKTLLGVKQCGSIDRKLRFMRRVPVDPMTNSTEWGLRCYQDEPDATSWCGENVYDVHTTSEGKALDGTKYSDW
jgi:general secretion pathway protein G